MNIQTDTVTIQCRSSLQWVKDTNQIIIVDEQHNAPIILQGAEVAIWEWLTLEYPYAKLLKLVEGLLKTSTDEAAQQLSIIAQRWQALGLLEANEGHDG